MKLRRTGWLGSLSASLLLTGLALAPDASAVARLDEYIGSKVCRTCHNNKQWDHKYSGWAQTAHNQILRGGGVEASYINDADLSGHSDFFDSGGAERNLCDLPGGDAFFIQFGSCTEAPVIGSNPVTGPYIRIGDVQYDIVWTLGGSAVQSRASADANTILGPPDGLIHNAEAQWRQLYLGRIGPSRYVLPVQFNAKTAEYALYHPEEWYDATGAALPIDRATVDRDQAYERRCAGCHSTGVNVARSAGGAFPGEWSMSFTDLNVACEACHGPGRAHVEAPDALKKSRIVNPTTLTTTEDLDGVGGGGTPIDNMIMQNYVCTQCHQKGTGQFSALGTPETTLLYPSMANPQGRPVLYRPGMDLRDYFATSQDANDYWGAQDKNGNGLIDIVAHEEDLNRNGVLDPGEDANANGVLDRKEFIAAASSQMQGVEHAGGPHAADKPYDHPCFTCHDMHKADRLHLLVSENEGVPVPQPGDSTAQRNNLCLSCHATHGDFAGLTEQDLIDAGVAGSPAATKVTDTVRAHVKNRAFMDVGFQTRCISCHMVPAGKSAIEPDIVYDSRERTWVEVRGGDLHSHTFEPIWPGFVMQPGGFQWTDFLSWWESNESFEDPLDGTDPHVAVGPMPDSCTSCHAHDPNVPENDNIVTQWAQSGHGDGYAEPWNHWNADPSISATCSRCHSAYGYRQLADSSTSTDPAKPTPFGVPWYTLDSSGIPVYTNTSQSPVYPKVLNCEGCHEPNGGGMTLYQAGKLQEVAFPSGVRKTLGNSSNVCMQCHQGRQSGKSPLRCSDNPSDTYEFVVCSVPSEHYLPEAATFWGTEVTAGYEYAGKSYQGQNTFESHDIIQKQDCVSCHLNKWNGYVNGQVSYRKDHNFRPELDDCSSCHKNAQGAPIADFEEIGTPGDYWSLNVDYDGDGVGESYREEMDGLMDILVYAMNVYALTTTPIRPPLMFVPGQTRLSLVTNGCYIQNGCTPESVPIPPSTSPPSYAAYDERMVKAAYNWNAARDRAAAIHNHKYVIQTMYDSIEDMNPASAVGLIRP